LPGLSGFTGIDAKSELGASGDAGDLYVTVAGALTLQSGGEITASTASVGSAGRVILQAGSIVINGAAAPEGASTGIFDQSLQGIGRDSGGAADDLNVTVAGAVELDSGGQIAASTFTSGAAGKLKVQATSLDINGAGAPAGATGILDQSELGTDGDTGGAAGDLKVVVKRALTIEGAGEITAATFTSGDGGDLSIRAGSIEVDGASSSIQVESLGAGNAGKAGGITIASHQLNVANGGAVSATAQNASGGNIGVQISDSMDLSGGMIKATAGKNGGNITIDAGYLSLENGSAISANAVQGEGGTLIFNIPGLDAVLGQTSGFYLVGQDVAQSGNSVITATSDAGIPGQLLSNAPYVNLANGLVALGGSLVGANTRLEDTCATAIQGQFSSFLETGQGDIEAAPDEALGETGDVTAHSHRGMKAHHGKQ
jgi:large exoprotein involved in heme utilization and adhesion